MVIVFIKFMIKDSWYRNNYIINVTILNDILNRMDV